MGLFGKRRFLDPDVEDWCLGTWGWLMTNFGGMERLRGIPLAAPTHEFFPPTAAEGHDRALYVFERVKSLMGMDGSPCRLDPFGQPASGKRAGFFTRPQGADGPTAGFRIEEGIAVIGYTVDLVAHPEPLIATFASALAHYQIFSIQKPIPGGADFYELASELALAFDGFALFGARGAFRSQQNAFALGLTGRSVDSFSEPLWAFALAVFAALKEIEVPHDQLTKSAAHLSREAVRYLQQNEPLLAPLRAIA